MKNFLYDLSLHSKFRVLQLAIVAYFLLLLPLRYLVGMAIWCSFGGSHPLNPVLLQGCVLYVGVAIAATIWAGVALQKSSFPQFYIALASPLIWVGGLFVLAIPWWLPDLLWNHSCYPWSWWLATFGL